LPGFLQFENYLQRVYVFCLRSFQAFTNGELNLLSFFQGLAAFTDDLAEVNKNVTLALTGNETKTFFVIEPFYGTSDCI
jgi:hypothetical protein